MFVWRNARWTAWIVLLCSWLLCWWPHGIIAVAFAWNGANRHSFQTYREWGSRPFGLFVLITSVIELVWHFLFSIAGFIATGRALLRAQREQSMRFEPDWTMRDARA